MKKYPLVLLFVLLAGCVTQQQRQSSNPIKESWLPSQEVWQSARKHGLRLEYPGGRYFVPAATINNLLTAHERIAARAGIDAELVIVETDTPNAFAFDTQGRRIVAVSRSFLEHLGHDRHAIATIVGHEFGHLKLGHSGAARQQREQSARDAGNVVGTLMNLVIPFSGTAASLSINAYANSFSRDEERAADDLGLQWAADAGYDPCGKIRAVELFSRMGHPNIPMLSSHPSYGERSEQANEYAKKDGGKGCN